VPSYTLLEIESVPCAVNALAVMVALNVGAVSV